MRNKNHFVLFNIDHYKFALNLKFVERIARAVSITPLPKAPEIVMGVINLQGKVLPVVNLRKRFNLKEREISLDDHLIVGHMADRMIAILVDNVSDIIEIRDQKIIDEKDVLSDMGYLEGVTKLGNDIILVQDLQKLLFDKEKKMIASAVEMIEKRNEQAEKAPKMEGKVRPDSQKKPRMSIRKTKGKK